MTDENTTENAAAPASQVKLLGRRYWIRNYRCMNKQCCDGLCKIQVVHTTDTKTHLCSWCGSSCLWDSDEGVVDA